MENGCCAIGDRKTPRPKGPGRFSSDPVGSTELAEKLRLLGVELSLRDHATVLEV